VSGCGGCFYWGGVEGGWLGVLGVFNQSWRGFVCRCCLLNPQSAANRRCHMTRLQTFPLSQWREALAANATAHRNSKVAFVKG